MANITGQTNLSDSNRFLWLFGIGAGCMLLFKLVLSVPQIFVTIPPALIMVLYFFQLMRGHHDANRPERAGDNIYYLGFLFTLVSLGLALFEFGLDATEKGGLIADFAIALTTTILGVLFRVWLTQGDKAIEEYEKEARLHITDAIDELQNDLKRSREVMEEFATTTRQVLEENRDEQRKQMELDREAFEKHFQTTLDTMGDVLTNAVKTSSERLSQELEILANNISTQVGVFTKNVESLNTASSGLSTSLTEVVTSLQAMPDPVALIEEKVQGIVAPLQSASGRMVEILQDQQAWAGKSASGVNEIVTLLTTLGESIELIGTNSSASLAKLHSPVDAVLDRISKVEAALSSIVGQVAGLETFTGSFEEVPQRLNRALASVDALGSAIGDSTKRVSGSLNALQHEIERARETHTQAVNEDTGKLRLLVDERDQVHKGLSEANQQIDTQVRQLRDQLGAISNALIGTVKYLNTEAGSIS